MSRAGRLAAVACTFGLSLLAACGGGGGSSTPPITPTTNPAPSGNPSGNPSSTPSGNPSSTPSGNPSGNPSPNPTPTTSTTPAPTPTPVKTPTPAPTATPVQTPTPTPSSTPNRLLTVNVGAGQINGADNQILSSAPNTHHNNGEGDLMPGDPDATSAGGGQGSPVDADQSFPWSATMGNGIQASTSMAENYYHVHVFLGLIVNPTTFDAKNNEIAIPDGIGMVNPVGDFQDTDPSAPSYNTCTGTNPNVANFECYADSFYYIHTHDPSGAIHLEAPAPTCGAVTNYTVPCNTSVFTLGNVLDVWGISISPNNFGHYTGPVGVYVSPQKYAPCGSTSSGGACYTPSNEYTQFTGDPRTIHLYSHTVVWIVVGAQPPQPSALPNIQWFLSF